MAFFFTTGPGDASEEAVQYAEDHHGERAVPRADDRGVRRRHGGDQGREHGEVQRDAALARPPPAAERVGGRPGVRDAVPHPPRRQLHLPLRHPGAGGHPVVARAQLVHASHGVRRPRHPAEARRWLPVPDAIRGEDRLAGGVVERRPRRPGEPVLLDRHTGAERRRVHHQRNAGRFVPLSRDD